MEENTVKSLNDVSGEIIYCKKKPIQLRAKELKERVKIETREGVLYGEEGDFLMEGIDFEVYPIGKSIFFRTYDILNGEPEEQVTEEIKHKKEEKVEFIEETKHEEKEEVLLAQIYKKDGVLNVRHSKSASQFEVFGFLRCYVRLLEKDLMNAFEGTDAWEIY